MGKYSYSADCGALRIDTPAGWFLYGNGIGDGGYKVEVHQEKCNPDQTEWEFVECFGVKTEATVSAYDCEDDPVCTLKRGRWAVYRRKQTSRKLGNMLLEYWDDYGCPAQETPNDR